MPRRGDNIRKRKDGRWEARYVKEDCVGAAKKYGSVYGRTYQEAKERRDKVIKEGPIHRPAHTPLFSDVLSAWQDANRVRLKDSSVSRYQNLIDTHILPEFGHYCVNHLITSAINRFLVAKMESGRTDGCGGLSANYVRSITLVISSAIKFGVSEGLCSPLLSPVTKPSLSKKELCILSVEDQNTLESELLENMQEDMEAWLKVLTCPSR